MNSKLGIQHPMSIFLRNPLVLLLWSTREPLKSEGELFSELVRLVS